MQDLKEFAESPSSTVKGEFVAALRASLSSSYPQSNISDSEIEQSISSPDKKLGDISSSMAFRLAKAAGTNPKDISNRLLAGMKASDHIASYSEAGGYINAFVDEKKYGELVLRRVMEEKERYGSSAIGGGEKVIVEFPSVNPAHPWHVGHVRNALLGDSISSIMSFCSYKVEREDYIDDLGLQVATALWGWLHLDNKPSKKFDQWLGELYVRVNKEMEGSKIKDEIDELMKKLEEGGSPEAKAGREMAENCVRAQQETAFAYGIFHDVMIWESDIVRAHLLSKALDIAAEHGILERPGEGKYANAIVVKLDKITKYAKELEGSREDAKVIVRSNGTATYIGKDFAFHAWKFGLIDAGFKYQKLIESQPNGLPIYTTASSGSAMQFGGVGRAINIIDSGQTYEQLIMRVMFSLLGNKEVADNMVHLAYGKVNIEGEKLSARSGNWLGEGKNYTADDLLRETKMRALAIAQKSEKITNKDELEGIVNAIALSAIKFEYLRIAPEKSMLFSWKTALSFEGNSGPYVMYTYARARKILTKAMGTQEEKQLSISKVLEVVDASKVTRGYDFDLLKKIGVARESVEKACRELRPNVLTDYLLDLASLFSKFYESMPVIKGEEAKSVRLSIVYTFTVVVENLLGLLGISPVSEM